MKRTTLKRRTRLRAVSRKAVSVKELDRLWSQVVRQRADWRCIIPDCTAPPQGCHYYPKGSYPALRHDPDNGFGACYKHHIHGWHKEPDVQDRIKELLEAERGPGFVARLRLRAQTARRPDKAAVRLALEMELGAR